MLSVALQYSFVVLWWSVRWRTPYSGGRVGECILVALVNVFGHVGECWLVALLYSFAVLWRLVRWWTLYSGGQHPGGRCTLEVALVNAVGHVAVRVRCTMVVMLLYAGGQVALCWQLMYVHWRLLLQAGGRCTLEVALVNAGGRSTSGSLWVYGTMALYAGIMLWQSHCCIRVDC